MIKQNILRETRFGQRIAEEELNQLETYFVATDQWQRVFSGEVDIVYGSKGSGKSAIYALIDKRKTELFDRNIIVSNAENVRGNTAFSEIISSPPPTERDFIDLWKLYLLIIVASSIRDYGIRNENTDRIVSVLEEAKLLPNEASISQLFRLARGFIWKQLFPDIDSVETTISFDPTTGLPIFVRNTKRRAESAGQPIRMPLDDLLGAANRALSQSDFTVWVLFDRLDVAFNDNPELEKNALRALFRTYNDIKGFDYVCLKIFVRDDIWDRITEGGFSEASHITKTTKIDWSYENLVNLFIRRLLSNQSVVDFLKIEPKDIVEDFEMQEIILKRVLPDKVETGNNPLTFRWMINRIQDATGKPAPRELIHLSEMIREKQVERLERGEDEPEQDQLFERSVFKLALKDVSKVRYEQTFKAENPSLSEYTDKLKGGKTEHSIVSLCIAWSCSSDIAQKTCDRLVKSGFFERRSQSGSDTYWVPFLYRDALELTQGRAAEE